MNICIISPGLLPVPPKRGGAIEKIIYELAKFIGKRHKVVVFHVGTEKYEGNVFFTHLNKYFKGFIAEFFFGVRCFFFTFSHKFDIIHLHTPFSALPFAFFKFFLKSKLVYTCHNPAWTVNKKELDIGNKFILMIESFVMKRMNKVVALSERMKKNMKIKNVIIIPNFADTKKFKTNGPKWKKPKGKMVLFVGKLTKTKGVDYLIKAIPKVKMKIKNVNFVFVGSPSFEKSEKVKLTDNAIFLGPVSEGELPKIYRTADVFCLPSLREGMPVVVLEALASGTPVVVTDVSGVKEIVNEKNGLIVERKNSDALANALIKILNKKFDRKEVSKTIEKYKKEKILMLYEKLFNNLKFE